MAIAFPTNPVDGQVSDNHYYDATRGVWKAIGPTAVPSQLTNATLTNPLVKTAGTTQVPLTVQGYDAQTANIQEWKTFAGTTLASVTNTGSYIAPSGTVIGSGYNILKASTASWSPLVVQGATSQTGDLQQWQNSSGIVLSKVNTSGIYNTPNTPYFSATRSTNLTGYNPSNQSNVIIYDSVDKNIGNAYNASTGKFTAPISGTYVFTVGVYQSVNVSQIWPVVNGSRQQSFIPTATSPNWAVSGTQYLAAGDNIGFCAWSDGNTNVTVYTNGFHTFIRGTYIG